MVITGITFEMTVFTIYCLFRYILQRNDFFKGQLLVHMEWEIFFLTIVFVTICLANRLNIEVYSNFCVFKFSVVNFCLQSIDRLYAIVIPGQTYRSDCSRYHEFLWRYQCGFLSMGFCISFPFHLLFHSLNWNFLIFFSNKISKVGSIVSANTKLFSDSDLRIVQFWLEFIIHCEFINM